MSVFSGKSATPTAPPAGGLSIVAVGMTVRGDIESNGTVKVEGGVEGHVTAQNQVLVARGGVVQGDIDAREAIVGGAVHGSIRATERVEVQAGATVNGDITTRRISVAEGGNLNGQINMGELTPEARPDSHGRSDRPAQQQASSAAPPSPSSGRPSMPVARVAVPPRLPSGP